MDPQHWWRAAERDYPGILILDVGAPAIITSMNITGGDPSFKTLRVYRTDDGRTWSMVRSEATPLNCNAGSTTEHKGWAEPTRYLRIQMEERCSGVADGRFTVAEWRVYGYFMEQMVLRFAKTWPVCENLGPCFSFVDLQDAIATCLANTACDGFSFSAASMKGGRGAGCYKTTCRDASARRYGRGTHGYWAKRHGCTAPSFPSYLDSESGLQLCGP